MMGLNLTRQKPSGLCITRVENFGVTRGNMEILNDVSFEIHCGELTAIIGPNGAGKSTLLKAMLGVVPHSGKLTFLDEKGIHTTNPIIGYVPQHIEFDRDSPISVQDLFLSCKTNTPVWLRHPEKLRNQVLESLSRVEAEGLINRRLGNLSGGELQKVFLALALDPIPDILLLDEPVSGIDQKGLNLFYNMVSQLRREFDLSIILVSHDLGPVAEYADRVVLLNRTVEACGSPDDIFESQKFAELFGNVKYKSLPRDAKAAGNTEER